MPCVFCRLSPPVVTMSSEHIFGKWLRNILPTVEPSPDARRRRWVEATGSHADETTLEGQVSERGAPHRPFDVTTKAVCKRCNESWLERIEAEARTPLIPLLEGLPHAMTWRHRAAVATWGFKASALLNLVDDSTRRALGEREFQRFYETKRPLPSTRVWLASAIEDPTSNGDWFHMTTTLMRPSEVARQGPAPNTQLSSVYLGRIIVLVFATRHLEAARQLAADDLVDERFVPIWPTAPTDRAPKLSDRAEMSIDDLAEALGRFRAGTRAAFRADRA